MRILHVLDHSLPLHSGYVFRTMGIVGAQRALGWQPVLLTSPKQGPTDSEIDEVDGWTIWRTPQPRGVMAGLPVAGEFALMKTLGRRLDQAIEALSPDIIHAHSPALNGLPAVRAGRRHGIPVVYEVRAFWEDAAVDHGTAAEWGPRYRATRYMDTMVLRRADQVITICEGLRRDIVQRGIDGGKVSVVPNAVDSSRFDTEAEAKPELRTSLGLDGCVVLGFFGSYYAYEGLVSLIEALPALLRAKPEVRLLMAGGGHEEDRIKERVKALDLQDQVIMVGRVPADVVQDYYALADILVYPRLPMRLTDLVTPLKPLEAMAMQRIVVASDVGGHKELIADDVTGYLFPAGSPKALAERLIGVMDTRGDWPAIKANGLNYVRDERNWTVSIRRHEQIYGRLMT